MCCDGGVGMIPHIQDYHGKKIHLIGIGGSSMSGLAEMLMDQGYIVSGSDRDEGYLINTVRNAGARVMIGHKAENVAGADLVVYSAAISPDNPERAEADRLGIPSMERAYLLGQLMEGFGMAVGVCGAHGKTTVTSMLSQILLENGKDPSIHIGGRLDAIGGSTRVGHSDLFVAEACEFNRSFLHMNPTMAVVLNIDADHLDCYRDIDEIEETFGQFLHLLPEEGGIAVGNGDDPRVRREIEKLKTEKLFFGLSDTNDFYAAEPVENEAGIYSFDLIMKGTKLAHVSMGVPGLFNVMNALAAMAAAIRLGVPAEEAADSISRFKGAHRRFELTGVQEGVELFHDYGHNPAEMRNAISIARKRCEGRLWAVMQPHTFSRVRALFEDYLTCTEEADYTLVTDICAAREKDPGDLNSGMLVDGMRRKGIEAIWTPSFDDTERYLREHWWPGDLVITMGCGDINMLNAQMNLHYTSQRVPRNRRTVSMDMIRRNMMNLRRSIPADVQTMAVVKADGYGHGAVAVSKAAIAGGADALAVASVDEGGLLRQAGISAPILVLGVVTAGDVQDGIRLDLTQTVCSPEMIRLCEKAAAEQHKYCTVHLAVDTGMGRIGVRSESEIDDIMQVLDNEAPHVRLTGAFTHFADADGDAEGRQYTREQFALFKKMTDRLPAGLILHCDNSAAMHLFPEMSLNMVRIGISLYGYPPVPVKDIKLQPCMRWTAKVNYVKDIPTGTYVSYGRTWQADRTTRVATITCGYADGYHRNAVPGAKVLIRGRNFPIISRICMDQMMADITDGGESVVPEDEVILMGSSGDETITAEDIARWSRTISYEILFSSSSRVEHVCIPFPEGPEMKEENHERK